MKLIVNERDGCCESIQIEYTPVEALIINQAMRRYVNDEDVHERDRSIMKQMLDVKPIFVDVTPNQRTGYWIWDKDAFLCSKCGSGYKEQPTLMGKPMFKHCPICGIRMEAKSD